MDLAFETISGPRAERAVVFLHGILGSGRNLQTLARRFVEGHPDWAAWLVDLPGHGRSPKRPINASVAQAGQDLVELAAKHHPALRVIVGHSFGGKVALEAARLEEIASLKDVVLIDCMPGAREPLRGADSALGILDIVETLPAEFSSITEFVAALEQKGLTRQVAQWLAGSLARRDSRLRFNLDSTEIRALLGDYFARDLWPVVENPPGGLRIHLVIGDRSDAYSPSDRERAWRSAASNSRVSVDVLPAGHWVHVDDLEGLLAVMDRLG